MTTTTMTMTAPVPAPALRYKVVGVTKKMTLVRLVAKS